MMKEMLQKKLNKKGFTLAELLIVVAILAVLVAVAIPVFSGALSNAQVAVDDANYRSALGSASTMEILKASGVTYTGTGLPKEGDFFQTDGTWGTAAATAVTAKATASNAGYPTHSVDDYIKYTATGVIWSAS